MYMLRPDDDWQTFKASGRPNVPQMVDPVTGVPRVEQWPRPGTTPRKLLDFPVLRGINKVHFCKLDVDGVIFTDDM